MGDAERDAEIAVADANEEWIRQGADAEEAEANASNEMGGVLTRDDAIHYSDLGPWEARCRRAEDERDKIKAWAEATIAEADAVIKKRVEERDEARRAHVEAETVLREVMDAEAWDDPGTKTHETVRSWLDDRVLVARADAVLAGRAWNDDGEVK